MTRALFMVLLLTTGCTSVPSGAEAESAGGDASARSAPSAAVLTFTTDDAAAATGTVTLEAGGTVSASAADGTTFELLVPPEAVAGDTEITMTPLTDVTGIGDGAVHAVQLEPEGLEFYALVRLTITPAEPIPLADQLMFEAAGDGSDPGLALIDPTSEPIVLLLEHFSAGGAASVTSQQRAAFLEKSASNAERRIGNGIRDLLGAERARQLQGGSDGPEDLAALTEALEPLLEEFEREVVERRREAGTLSCEALRSYVVTVISFEQARTLLGMNDSTEVMNGRISEAVSSMTARYKACEQEAIAACKEAKDPKILIEFWLAMARQFGLAMGDGAAMKQRAEEICEPQGFALELTGTDIPLRTASIGTDSTADLVGQVLGCPISDDAWTFEGETTVTYTSGLAPWHQNLLDLKGNQSPDSFTVVLSDLESADLHNQFTPADFDESFLTVTDALRSPTAVLTLYNGLGERVGDFDIAAVALDADCQSLTP